MPRPKRRKVAPSAPTSRLATDVSTEKTTAARTGRGKKPKDYQRGTSQDDQSVNKLKRPVRSTRQRRTGNGEEPQMSGALGREDRHEPELKSPTASNDIILVPSTAEEPRENMSDTVRTDTGKMLARSNSISASTPLNLGHFRRRPRPGSILGRTQSDAEESDIEVGRGLIGSTPGIRSSALVLDKFKRRSRQPSLLSVGRNELSISDDDMHLNLDDSFNPEDGSTPFKTAKTRLEKNSNESASTPSVTLSNPRKRKITPVVPPSTPPDEQDRLVEHPVEDLYGVSDSSPNYTRSKPPNPQRNINPLSPTMAPPLSSSPLTSPSQEGQRPSVTELTLQSRRVPHSVPQAIPTDTETTVPTSPIPGSTMNRRSAKTKAAPKRQSISTADLQSLLPKRRRHSVLRSGSRGMTPSNDFDIPSSSDLDDSAGLLASPSASEAEEDISQHVAVKKRNAGSIKKPAKASKKVAPSKVTSRHVPTSTRAVSKRPATTYASARRGSSDKENTSFANDSLDPTDYVEGDDEAYTNIASLRDPKGQKLARVSKKKTGAVAKKFKEVDEWALEFEDVSSRTLGSSPWDAR